MCTHLREVSQSILILLGAKTRYALLKRVPTLGVIG